jgi:hypothetical protein
LTAAGLAKQHEAAEAAPHEAFAATSKQCSAGREASGE